MRQSLPRLGWLLCFVASVAWQGEVQAWAALSAAEAANHVGETATVCGIVASAKYATSSRGSPTFLNLDRPYPNHVFTALIWEEDRPKFQRAPESHLGERICVDGAISNYRGRPQIIITNPKQLRSGH